MIKPVTMYSMVCDRCGKTLVYDDYITAWTDERSTREVAQDSEWMNIDDKDYCPDCYEYDEDIDDYKPKKGGEE